MKVIGKIGTVIGNNMKQKFYKVLEYLIGGILILSFSMIMALSFIGLAAGYQSLGEMFE